MPDQTFNVSAGDHAKVGVQAGQINGPVTVHMTDEEAIRNAISELQQNVLAAYRSGLISEPVYASASGEIAKIEGHLPANSTAERNALRRILEGLGEAIGKVADIGSKIAAIVAMVHGL